MNIARTVPPRNSDPHTSHKAHRDIVYRANSQNAALLEVYGKISRPLIAEEAKGFTGKKMKCEWKRCSDMCAAGLLEIAGSKVNAETGKENLSYVITDKGRDMLQQLRRKSLDG